MVVIVDFSVSVWGTPFLQWHTVTWYFSKASMSRVMLIFDAKIVIAAISKQVVGVNRVYGVL